MLKYLIVVLVLVALCQVNGRSGRQRAARNKGIPEDATPVARWTRILTGNAEQQEAVYRQGPQIYFQSAGAGRKAQFKPSLIMYDFSAVPPVAILKIKKKCYLMETPQFQTSEALASRVIAYNGTRRTDSNTELTFYVADPTAEQTQQVQGRPAVGALCSRGAPLKALTQQQPPAQGRIKAKQVSGLDNILSVKTVKPARGGGGGGGGGGSGRRNRNERGGRNKNGGSRRNSREQ